MTIEPIYIAQTGEMKTRDEAHDWWQERAREAHEQKGCTFFRYSLHENPDALLIEGWAEMPPSQGRVRWQFASTGEEQ